MLPSQAAVLALALAPPALAGLLLGRVIERHLGSPLQIALALAGGSAAMLAAELRAAGDHGADGSRGPEGGRDRTLAEAGAADGLALGLAQALALIPGVSRSGATIAAARWRGFGRADAHRLSWIVALPVIVGAGLLQGLRLRRRGMAGRPNGQLRGAMAAGAGAAFCSTLAAGALLRGRVRDCPLTPFALYRGALAAWVLLRAGERR